MKVIANCPPNKSLSNRELTVDEIVNSAKKEDICVHFKEFGKIKLVRRRIHVPVVTICEHLGCSFKLINKEINESDDMDWIRDVTPIESPTLDPDKWYVVWLDDITPEEREYVGEWLFKKFPQCKDLPMSDGWWNNKRVISLRMNPCSVGGYTIRQPIEEAREAYDTWSRRMTVIDPIKILRGVSINESDDMQWIEDVSPSDLYIGVRFRLESPHPNLGRRTRGPIFTVTEVLGDEFTSIDTNGYVWVVNIDAWQEWKNENNLYILEPNKDLMLKGSYKMGDDIG